AGMSGRGAIVEEVAEVALACRAEDLGAPHAVAGIGLGLHPVRRSGRGEAGPTTAGVELRLRVEELVAAPGAAEDAGLVVVPVLPREGPLRALFAQHMVLLARQRVAPRSVVLLRLFSHVMLPRRRRNG